MRNALTLTEKETFFIKENRQDPITGDEFSIGDKIVFCASCKSAFLKDSWEYMNSKHCGQSATLKKFPVQSKLRLSKPLKSVIYTFVKAESRNRVLAYVLDNCIALVIGFLAYLFFEENYFFGHNTGFAGFVVANLYMLFRDGTGIKSSLGKRMVGLYFINTETQENASSVLLLFRNLIYWGCMIASSIIIGIADAILGGTGVVASILGFALFVLNIIHVIVVIANQNHFFDKMLKIELVEKNKQ